MNQAKQTRNGRIATFLRRFRRREDGILTIEAIMILPLMFWSIWASYTFFDSYRQGSRNVKAAYALADIISRERSLITVAYMDTLYEVLQTMAKADTEMTMRISYIRYDEPDERHEVRWSCVRGADMVRMEDADIALMKDRIPVMPDNGYMILVETSNMYVRPYKLGWGDNSFAMDNFVFTHPRVFDNIRIDGSNC